MSIWQGNVINSDYFLVEFFILAGICAIFSIACDNCFALGFINTDVRLIKNNTFSISLDEAFSLFIAFNFKTRQISYERRRTFYALFVRFISLLNSNDSFVCWASSFTSDRISPNHTSTIKFRIKAHIAWANKVNDALSHARR